MASRVHHGICDPFVLLFGKWKGVFLVFFRDVAGLDLGIKKLPDESFELIVFIVLFCHK